MSPQTSGRYQSQLLNFLNRQGQQWRDRLETWGRQTKIAALWGAQAALYPFYAVFQATRMATRQLQQQAQTVAQLLLPAVEVPSDLAINRVLYSLNPETPYSSTLRVGAAAPQLGFEVSDCLPQPETIEAIASDLKTRMIQLIAQGQPILVLDESAQGQMQRRITWEMATYWERWRRFQRRSALGQTASPQALGAAIEQPGLVPADFAPAGMLTIADRPQMLPPVRLFWQLMAWVQQGPLANQVNWFEETAIVAQPQVDWFQPHWQSDLGQTQLRLANNPDLVQVIKAAFTHFFGRTQLALEDGFKAVADPWSQPIGNQTIAVESIAVADDGFAAASDMSPIPGLPRVAMLQATEIAAVESLPAAATPPALPESNPDRKPRRSPLSRPASSQVRPQSSLAGASGGGDLSWANVFASDLTTTLIDTVATPIGYIQHPLERVLRWLDQAILWLETYGAKLWNWLTAWLKR